MSLSKEEVSQKVARLENARDLADLFSSANILYYAPGDGTATGLPERSVDVFYSYAVLEHVPERVIYGFCREAKRILKPTGCFYALIGLGDHFSSMDKNISRVNFLKYPEWAWSFFVKNDISYHNRLRERDFLDIFRECGATIRNVVSFVDPKDIETARTMKLSPRFARYSAEECAVWRTEIVASFE